MDDEVSKLMIKMREALDGYASSSTAMLNALPPQATALRVWLEAMIPAWDGVSQNLHLNPNSPERGVLLAMTGATQSALLELEKRIIALELASGDES